KSDRRVGPSASQVAERTGRRVTRGRDRPGRFQTHCWEARLRHWAVRKGIPLHLNNPILQRSSVGDESRGNAPSEEHSNSRPRGEPEVTRSEPRPQFKQIPRGTAISI